MTKSVFQNHVYYGALMLDQNPGDTTKKEAYRLITDGKKVKAHKAELKQVLDSNNVAHDITVYILSNSLQENQMSYLHLSKWRERLQRLGYKIHNSPIWNKDTYVLPDGAKPLPPSYDYRSTGS